MSNPTPTDKPVPTPADVAAKTAPGNSATSTQDDLRKASAQAAEQSQAPADDPDVFTREYVEKLRREAAGYRSKLKELEPLAKQFQEQQDANKTELEKAQEYIAKLEAEKQAQTVEATRARIAAASGVPAELLPPTADEEALTAAAEALKAWASQQVPTGAPKVGRVGAASEGASRDDLARSILGI